MIELVDFNELLLAAAAPKKTTRRSRKPAAAKTVTEVATEDVQVESNESAPEAPEASAEESTEEN
jgi:hypothetical protein